MTEDSIPTVTAGTVGAPPAWAVLQRSLIETMNDAAPLIVDKYTERGGAPYYADDLDDLYEIFFGWGLFYAIGGSERVLDMALDKWNAVTRWADSDIVSRKKHGMWNRGAHREPFRQQITKEYFNLALPHGAEWHHMGEANMTFYEMGLADPTISENFRRARRFAGFLIGEDPEAPNYDPVHKIIRSPIHSSTGPYLTADAHEAAWWLQGGEIPHARKYGLRATLHPAIEDLELDWYENPERADQVVRLFNDMVLNGDIANNLAATGLVTNAFLYTGDEKYRKWVLDYVEAWIDRTKANGGIIPDNVGPTGKPGEAARGPVVGRSLRLERTRLQQHRSLDHDRRAVRPASLRRLRIPRPAEVTDQCRPQSGQDTRRRPACRAHQARSPTAGRTTAPFGSKNLLTSTICR